MQLAEMYFCLFLSFQIKFLKGSSNWFNLWYRNTGLKPTGTQKGKLTQETAFLLDKSSTPLYLSRWFHHLCSLAELFYSSHIKHRSLKQSAHNFMDDYVLRSRVLHRGKTFLLLLNGICIHAMFMAPGPS